MEPSGIFVHDTANDQSFIEREGGLDVSLVEPDAGIARPDPSFLSDPSHDTAPAYIRESNEEQAVVSQQRTGRDPSVFNPDYVVEDDDEEDEIPDFDYIESSSMIEQIKAESAMSFVQDFPNNDIEHPFAKVADSIRSHSLLAKQGVTNNVPFRGSLIGGDDVEREREVTFVGNPDDGKELPAGSRISISAYESTLPMAFDNERFFDSENGYYEALKEALEKLRAKSQLKDAWREPSKEMGWFGSLWRSIVQFLMLLSTDSISRVMFTRGIQENLPFQTVYESFVLNLIVRAFDADSRGQDKFNLGLGFKNRNTSRVIVQFLSNRWDWFWHNHTQLRWARLFDFLSLFPFLGVFGFNATENFPNTKDHAIRAIIRPFFEGSWFTRFITGQQGIRTLNPNARAQNLAAESTGFEEAGRNQVGAFFGRRETNEFRFEHRLPTDESIFRTFISSPTSTLINNGVEHVTLCLAKHYRNMLFQENGNFAHQRMEQLNPFEFLRFHMPLMLMVFANLRGRNVWDMKVLGPFVRRLQSLNPGKIKKGNQDVEANDAAEIHGPVRAAQGLVMELKDSIVANVCGGVKSRMKPFNDLLDAIDEALTELGREAEEVKQFVASADTGIKLGYQLLKVVDWTVPSFNVLHKAVVEFASNGFASKSYHGVPSIAINAALQKLAPKDERTLKEMLAQELGSLEAAKLLVGRAATLLERELRRTALDERIREMSFGSKAGTSDLEKNKWYWLKLGDNWTVVLFKSQHGDKLKFIEYDAQMEKLVDVSTIDLHYYIPVAEAIARAQKAFMTIEIDHGKRFQYNAFMEFGSSENSLSLRTRLTRLVTVSQMFSYELDRARLNVLTEVKNSVLKVRQSTKFEKSRLIANCKPQNVTVLGGGPTGLLAALHCVHNVLLTGGKVRVLEGRDAFAQEGATFERAQIVRLDSRQISMLRYHLGTGFEDVYTPARGETDPHMGNTLPNQGFVEVTIKRLESMILDEIINLRSKGLLEYYADTKVLYDPISNSFSKKGDKLKPGDIVFDPQDETKTIEVSGVKFAKELGKEDLKEGSDYDLILPREKKQRIYRLQKADPQYDFFQFVPLEAGHEEVTGSFGSLPSIFRKGEGRADPVELMGIVNGKETTFPFDEVKGKNYTVDFSASHVVLATGKPAGSPVHFYTTTSEPYAVCCIEGIKISLGMHNLGEKRWGSGFIDDVRSHTDANTRVIGDFTKSVVLFPIVERMQKKMKDDPVWQIHFRDLPASVQGTYTALDKVILREVNDLVGTNFRRERLQTRFFELGNNYYLGMEFPREFDLWKSNVANKVAPALPATAPDSAKRIQQQFSRIIPHHLDRLWYESCLEIIKEGDVYNPGGRSTIPALYTIDSPFETELGSLQELDAFRMFSKKYKFLDNQANGFTLIQGEFDTKPFAIPSKTYVMDLRSNRKRELDELKAGGTFEPIDLFEVISKGRSESVVRTSRGYITKMSNSIKVGRSSDISRAPNGYSESKVGLASFPVAHVVCHRTLRLNRVNGKGGDDGFITAYVGDAQSSPHFMRYSGLTGACINCMSINNLVGQAQTGVGVVERVQRYAFETNWSNGEVVQRGTGANYGQDGFLRPGFPYRKMIDYMYGRATEHFEIGADVDAIVSRDWKVKIAAAIVPRGLENDSIFYTSLMEQLYKVLASKFEDEIKSATRASHAPGFSMDWSKLALDPAVVVGKTGSDFVVAKTNLLINCVAEALKQTIDFSLELRLEDKRISSELFNQPKSVDSITDDFAVEAQNFANALTQSSALTSGSVALGLLNENEAGAGAAFIFAALLGVWNIGVSFGSMTNVSRYRNRNEEMRRLIIKEKFPDILRNVFSLMSKDEQSACPTKDNPFLNHNGVDGLMKKFIVDAHYYNEDETKIRRLQQAYADFEHGRGSRSASTEFMRRLAGEFIPDVFHVSSYLQESLVDIYKAIDEMLELMTQNENVIVPEARMIHERLLGLQGQLTNTVELGHIYFGFIRKRPITETAIFSGLQFMLGPLLFFSSAQKTAQILRRVKKADKGGNAPQSLKRVARDLHELHHATQESRIAALMFLSAFIVFCFSIFFSFVRLIEFASAPGFRNASPLSGINSILNVAIWAALGTLIGAVLASFHFLRKLKHLFGLAVLLGKTSGEKMGVVRAVTWTQILLTLIRLVAVSLAAVSLPWSIVSFTLGRTNKRLPAQLAALSVITAIVATIFFFIVEFFIRYNLNPQLGKTVVEPLKDRVMAIKRSFTKPASEGIETIQRREMEAWDYTAREFVHQYRFDTVFAADRFGTILQYIKGMGEDHKHSF